MLKATLRQPCLQTQPGCPTTSEAVQNPCVCGTAEGDTGCWQERGSRGGQRCRQLRDAPAPELVKQEGWMGPLGGKASGSCRQEPRGLIGDTPDPTLDGGSLASVAEPTAPPKCSSSAPELPPTAASPVADPSQEWKVAKIQRVLINPANEPRKVGKRNPLWPPSRPPKSTAVLLGPGLLLPDTVLGTPGSSQGRTSAGLEVPGSQRATGTFLA